MTPPISPCSAWYPAGASRTVHGVDSATAPQVGEPVALVGFPLGLGLPVGGDGRPAAGMPSAFTGTVTHTGPDRIEVDGYGAAGGSGSPVFNAAGDVVGVVSGGGVVERTFQMSIETCIDVANDVIADRKLRVPGSYAEAFDVLAEAGILDSALHTVMVRMCGFRNLITRDYARLDPAEVIRVLREGLQDFAKFGSLAIGWE